jgi:hypothetical protein
LQDGPSADAKAPDDHASRLSFYNDLEDWLSTVTDLDPDLIESRGGSGTTAEDLRVAIERLSRAIQEGGNGGGGAPAPKPVEGERPELARPIVDGCTPTIRASIRRLRPLRSRACRTRSPRRLRNGYMR